MKPKVNEVLDDSAVIKKLEHELAEAKKELEEMKKELKQSKQEQRSSRVLSVQRSIASEGSTEDYGYEDMDAAPRNDPYVMPKDQPVPQDTPNNRQYVMPKNQDFSNSSMEEKDTPNNRQYVMPKNHDLSNSSEEDKLPLPTRAPNRAYVMPKSQQYQSKSDLGTYLKKLNEPEDVEVGLSDSQTFKLDAVDPTAAERTINRYMQGRGDSVVSDDVSGDDSPDGSRDGSRDAARDGSRDGARDGSRNTFSAQDRVNSFGRPFSKSSPQSFDFPVYGKGEFGTPDRRNETTLPTEDESYDGPEGSYADISLKFGSVVSTPDTLRVQSVQEERSKYGTLDSAAGHALDDRRINNTLSWDTMDLKTMQPADVGHPIRAMKSLYKSDAPIPEEITIICAPILEGKEEMCLTDRLKDAQERSFFLDGKVEMADDLVEAVFKDLDRARLCIHDLVYRNVQLASKLKEKRREDIKEEYQQGEVAVEQYWLLKGSMYVGLFFFITGGYEFFMAAVLLIWLILEANLSA
jgi:hypothetical protein